MRQKGFTLIELVFVIIIIGILSFVALSQWGEVVATSYATQGKATLAQLRTALALDRQRLSSQGENPYRLTLDDASMGAKGIPILEGNSSHPLLEGIKQSEGVGTWKKTGLTSYVYTLSSTETITLTYDPSTGRVVGSGKSCSLIE